MFTMEIHVGFILSGTLLLIQYVDIGQAVTECPYGKYFDPDANECRNCSPCPKEVILGTSSNYAPIAECKQHKSLCPTWCSEYTWTTPSQQAEGRNACPPTTPSPPVPFMNVTIEESHYNVTSNSYTASCTMLFRNMETPTLEWYDPLGQLLPNSSSKGNVTTLHIKDFQEGYEGNYSCLAQQGSQSDEQTIFLKYVKPPVITSTPFPTTPPGSFPHPDTPKPDEKSTPQGGLSTLMIVVIASVPVVVILCGIAACLYICEKWRNKCKSTQRRRLADLESHPLTGTSPDFVDRLYLETSDFQSGKVVGIQACLEQPNCTAVIIKQNKKKIKEVQSGQDSVYIRPIAWNDSIEVLMKFHHKKIKCVKTLKMNCLKISNTTETSALVTCPSNENTFYLRYKEKNVSSSSEQVHLIKDGSEEISNLRTSMKYCVYLGIKGQTGDSGAYNWVWKDEFTTEGIKFQPVVASDKSAKLSLSRQSIPGSVQLYYAINQSQRKQMTSAEVQISSLVPGMDQILQIMVKEDNGGTSDFRLLQEIPFKTTGYVKDGGDFKGYATTDYLDSDSDGEPDRIKSCARRKLDCHTGLLEAIHTFRDNRKYIDVYLHTEQSVLEAVFASLLEFLKDFKNTVPKVQEDLRSSGRKGMESIEDFIKRYAMEDYTGIFDLLRRFIQKDKAHSQAGVHFAEQLWDAHCQELHTCSICKHAVFLLRRNVERNSCQSLVC